MQKKVERLAYWNGYCSMIRTKPPFGSVLGHTSIPTLYDWEIWTTLISEWLPLINSNPNRLMISCKHSSTAISGWRKNSVSIKGYSEDQENPQIGDGSTHKFKNPSRWWIRGNQSNVKMQRVQYVWCRITKKGKITKQIFPLSQSAAMKVFDFPISKLQLRVDAFPPTIYT